MVVDVVVDVDKLLDGVFSTIALCRSCDAMRFGRLDAFGSAPSEGPDGRVPEPFGFLWEHAILLAGTTLYPAIERYGCQCQDDMWASERPLSYATERMMRPLAWP